MKNQLSVLHPGLDNITSFHGSPTFESTKGYTLHIHETNFYPNYHCLLMTYIIISLSSPTIGGLNEDKVISELVLSLEEANILGRMYISLYVPIHFEFTKFSGLSQSTT